AGAAAAANAGAAAQSTVASAAAECAANKNGGGTETGVTADAIKLGATIVADGPGSSFLGPVRVGMLAVVNKVNKAGGICGRRLGLTLRNDSWDAERGKTFLQNFVESDKVFALAVVPSSEGLQAANEYIKQKGVPVVGSDGMLAHQYQNPWIWPVATSTASTMHIMAKNAHDRGARHFGIVFDAKYHFGVEGAFAFNEAVKRLTNEPIPGYNPSKRCDQRYCGIQPQKPSYASEARSFNSSCYQTAPRCDFVAFLVEPDTALSFIRESRDGDPTMGTDGFGLAQPLFTRGVAESCQRACDGMWVWTGYNPPIEALASQPGVARYVADVRQESATADVTNQFLEGGYLGMSLLVEALGKVGPNLTRANLRAALDSMTFDAGLSSPLTWRPGNHFANRAAQAFAIQYKQSFNGWRQKTGFIEDPWLGQDMDG
ncbi:MAG: ABC transporter substrate-binding protein, partial [Actinomycetota bacterium]|nr:ABC transporter substrate-binding protein [Actinomycetota bacterium]